MKKTLSLFVMLLTCMTMMAETVRIDFTQTPDEQSPNKVVWKVGDLTFTVDKGNSKHDVNGNVQGSVLDLFEDQVITFSSTGSTTILRVTINGFYSRPTNPKFSTLQECEAEYAGLTTVLTALNENCTSMGGTLSNNSNVTSIDIETGVSTSGGGDNPSGVDSEALRDLYVDFLNYRPKVEVHHLTAFYIFLAVEQHVDEVSEHFENQQECDDLYVWLLEKFNIIREMAGDTPYNESEYTPRGFQTDELDQLLHNAEKYYDSIVTSHPDQAVILITALNDAKTMIADIASQADVETIYNALLTVFNNVKEACENGEEPPVTPDEEGTPMAPIKPDLSQYTHKMMVLGAPWGVEDLCMAILRDNEGRVVQKMTMRIDGDNLSAHMTDSVRTYAYEDNKMIEYLAVPYYDQDDVLHMEPMNRTTTSYYKLTNGHREVVEQAWFEDGDYVANNRREEYIFDNEGRKVSYKKYYGDELEANLTYTYDENGGCLARGKYDGYSNYTGYTRYDANGNLRGNTEWGTYYEYFYDNQNHYQGYKYYYDYNFDDNTYGSVNDNNYFEVLESYADGSIKKMKRKGDGEVRTYSREGNVETQINTPAEGAQVTITRTFDDQGRIVAKTSTNRTFKSNYIYSDLKADQVLGGVNTFDEDLHTNYQEQVNWTYSNPLLATSYEYTFWGFNEKAFTTYNIVPLSVLPAQTTEEGVAISVGNDGDQVVLSNEGEIYLLDKGGKKRYSVSIGGITVSSEGGKIVVTGWTPISPDASANAMRMAPKTIDLTTNEYDIYIPEDVITINGKPLNEVYLPITLEEESTGIVEVKTGNRNTYSDGHLYNLQGIQVTNPANGQIVIMNGKKVVVK